MTPENSRAQRISKYIATGNIGGVDVPREIVSERGGASEPRALVRLKQDLAAGGNAPADFLFLGSNGWQETNYAATVYEISSAHSFEQDDIAWATWSSSRKRWEVQSLVSAGGQPEDGLKPLVRFTLDDDLTSQDASQTATITDQWGPGVANANLTITAHNLETSDAGNYFFKGEQGDVGLAFHDSGQNYRILLMEDVSAVVFKRLVRFELDDELTKQDASQEATIVAQYGDGEEADEQEAITVHNFQLSDGSYLFAGDSGAKGLAYHDSGTDYRILLIEPEAGDQDNPDSSPVVVKGYLTGKLLASESQKTMTVTEVCGKGVSVGDTIPASNPTSRLTGSGVFEAPRDAWAKATRNNEGNFGFDVIECDGEDVEQEYTPENDYRSDSGQDEDSAIPIPPGAFGGGAVDDREHMFELFVETLDADIGPVSLENASYKLRLAFRRWLVEQRAKRKAARREGAASRRGRSYSDGMRQTFASNVQAQVNLHRQIHQSWANYYSGVNDLIGALARRKGGRPKPPFRG